MIKKSEQRKRRHARIRSKISGTASIPRLSVFRSSKHIYAQLIDDSAGMTLVSSSDNLSKKLMDKPMTEKAKYVGTELAKKAKIKEITKVIFDRGGFKYSGNIEALALSARKGGLKF